MRARATSRARGKRTTSRSRVDGDRAVAIGWSRYYTDTSKSAIQESGTTSTCWSSAQTVDVDRSPRPSSKRPPDRLDRESRWLDTMTSGVMQSAHAAIDARGYARPTRRRRVTRDDVQRWLDAVHRCLAQQRSCRHRRPVQRRRELRLPALPRARPWSRCARRGLARIARRSRTWEAHYAPYAVDGDRAVAVGESRYLEHGKLARLYYNVWLLRFDGQGRCAEFVEYWREHPEDSLPS